MPDGLVALGDAACTFNPQYGQGMTVATLGAMLLAEMVAARLPGGPTASAAPSSARVQALAGLSKVPHVQTLNPISTRLPQCFGKKRKKMKTCCQLALKSATHWKSASMFDLGEIYKCGRG